MQSKKDNKTKFLKFFRASQKCGGFSLIEILIAVFVFFIAITMLMGSFSSFMKNYTNSKRTQKDAENAQYAMNLMAKTIRTSIIVVDTPPLTAFPLNMYDYSQGLCIQYKYSQSNKKIQIGSIAPGTADQPSSCQFSSITTFSDLTATNVIGAAIYAVPTATNYGKVTIVLRVRDQSNSTAEIPIQMSVSLRQ